MIDMEDVDSTVVAGARKKWFAMTDRNGNEVKALAWAIERLGLPVLYTVATMAALYIFATWTRADFMQLQREKREDQQAFLSALRDVTKSFNDLQVKQAESNKHLESIDQTLRFGAVEAERRADRRRAAAAASVER